MADFVLNQTPLLSRSTLDRAEHLRADAGALQKGWDSALVLRVNRRSQARVDGTSLVLDPVTGDAPPDDAVFLGVHDERHIWAVRDDTVDGDLRDLRAVGAVLDDTQAGMLTTAVGLLFWHAKSKFSAIDGTPTKQINAGWSRVSETGNEEFPRSDPAVICLVHDGADRVLLARQHTWPETMLSILAGFAEVGESLETCVRREILEEVGVDVTDVRYLGSQPWPFPRSLMLGFAAVADPEQPLEFKDGEIAEAHWFTRSEVRAALAAGDWSTAPSGRLRLPASISIARVILESWAATTDS